MTMRPGILSGLGLIVGIFIFWLLFYVMFPCLTCSREGFIVESLQSMTRPYVRKAKSYMDATRRNIKRHYPKISRTIGF